MGFGPHRWQDSHSQGDRLGDSGVAARSMGKMPHGSRPCSGTAVLGMD